MKINYILIYIFLLIFHFFQATVLYGYDYEDSIVEIRVTTQKYDFYSPWQKENHNIRWIHGCVLDVDKGLIATLSLPLKNHIWIEVVKHGEQRRYPAKALLKDYRIGIALITVLDKSFFLDLKPTKLFEEKTLPEKGVVLKWDSIGRLKSYPTEYFSSSIQTYEELGGALIFQMITGLDSGGSCEPVFQDGKLIGLTAWFESNEKTIKVNAVENLKWMLNEIEDGIYKGQPCFWMNTVYIKGDENLKDYLNIPEEEGGILVGDIPPKVSGYRVLKKNDVILSIDGNKINDNGTSEVPIYGKLNFMSTIILNHFVGETIMMEIIREKKKMEISFPILPITNDVILIPPFHTDEEPKYYIIGGLVFQELTSGYMTIWGNEWEKKADKRLLNHIKNYWIYPSENRRRIVLLNRILPAESNKGYHSKANLILRAINGIFIYDIVHLKEIIESISDNFIIFDFEGEDDIVLEKKLLIESTNDILRKYEINKSHNLE